MPTALPMPRRLLALKRGFARHCPNCGKGPLFRGYLTLVEVCACCGERLGHIRADDLPAYLTIFIVGHVVVALMLAAIQLGVPTWLGMPLCLAATVAMTLGLLPRIKGGVAAHLWRLKLPRGSIEAEG